MAVSYLNRLAILDAYAPRLAGAGAGQAPLRVFVMGCAPGGMWHQQPCWHAAPAGLCHASAATCACVCAGAALLWSRPSCTPACTPLHPGRFPGAGQAGDWADPNAERSYKPIAQHMTTVAGNEALVAAANAEWGAPAGGRPIQAYGGWGRPPACLRPPARVWM